MNYQLLAMDVDDTLVGRDKKISERNLLAIRKAQEAGIYVTIATGRGFYGSSMVWKELDIKGPVINYGGALMMDTKTGTPIHIAEMDSALVSEALDLAYELHVHAQLYQGDTVVFERENDFTKRYTGFLSLPYQVDSEIRCKQWKNVPKVLIYTDPSKEEEIRLKFIKRFQNRLEIAVSMPGYIELNQFGTNKGSMLLKMGEYLGVSRERIAAIGDNTLDTEMIREAGLGACVGNGQPQVKAVADIITPNCEEDGIAWFIENCLLNE